MDFDQILQYIGEFGSYQRSIYFISTIASILVGMHMLSNVFAMAVPKSRCWLPECDTPRSQYIEDYLSFTIPTVENDFSSCLQFQARNSSHLNITCSIEDFLNSTIECQNGWIWDKKEFDSTTVTEWDLVCDSSWIISVSQSIYMAGVLVGSILFGTISDKFGRHIVFIISPPILMVASIASAFANNWISYTFLKFLTAIAINGIFQTGFVVVIEFIGISKRAWCGNCIQISFAVGELVLGVMAYYIRDWRELQLAISIPIAVLLFYPCLVPESVRWLLARGRHEEAKAIILKVATKNRKPISNDMIDELFQSASSQSPLSIQKESSFMALFTSPVLLRRSLNIFFNWTVNSLVYYGLSLSASNLSGNTYVNFFALAAVEIPGVFLATLVQQWKGRRIVLCSVMLMGGFSCLGSALVPEHLPWLSTSLAVLGKSNIAASFAVIYIYSAEIFPTPLRNTGIGISSTFSRIGGIVAPVIADLSRINRGLPMFIFGGFSVAAGLLSLALPETHNKKLPETVAEAEKFGRTIEPLLLGSEDDESQDEFVQTPLLREKKN